MNKTSSLSSGFTLLETLIAVFLVTLAIVTFLGSASRGIVSTRQALNRVNAQLLAQEGIEIIRNIRDNQVVSAQHIELIPGSGILNPNFCSTNGCTVDVSSLTPTQPGIYPAKSFSCGISSSCAKLYLNNGLYSHTPSATPTPFSRVITIEPDGSQEAAKITSTVQWTNGASTDSIKVVTYLTNWFTQ